MPKLRLLESRPLTPTVGHFVFQAPFQHLAGQHIALEAELQGAPTKRYFSIASPPRSDCRIELCIRQDGLFGTYLRNLPVGAAVDSSHPTGKMLLLDAKKASAYFASGTGIAPVRAILLAQLAANPAAKATLVQGARHPAELHYREEFGALAERRAGFRYLPTVTGHNPDWNGRRGRVTQYFGEALGDTRDRVAYLCGQREMVVDLRRMLAKAGIGDERQSYERY